MPSSCSTYWSSYTQLGDLFTFLQAWNNVMVVNDNQHSHRISININESSIISEVQCNTNLILLDKAYMYQMNVYTYSKVYHFLTIIQCITCSICTSSKVAFTYWITTYSLPQTVCLHQDDAQLTKFFPHGSQYERHQVPSCWQVLNNYILRRTPNNQQSQHTHWVVLLTHNCTGPMLIAVFITEMVALHKYVFIY